MSDLDNDTICIRLPHTVGVHNVRRGDYVSATLEGLRESYPSLTTETINAQLDLLLSGQKWTNVIGAIMQDDIVVHGGDQ